MKTTRIFSSGIILFSFLILCISLLIEVNAQVQKVPGVGADFPLKSSALVTAPGGVMHLFWTDDSTSSVRNLSYKQYNGSVWSGQRTAINSVTGTFTDSLHGISAVRMGSGRLVVVWKFTSTSLSYSDDNGVTWSLPMELPTGTSSITRRQAVSGGLTVNQAGALIYGYVRSGVLRKITSQDNGATWTTEETLNSTVTNAVSGSVIETSAGKLIGVYSVKSAQVGSIFAVRSEDGGTTWGTPLEITPPMEYSADPKIFKADADSVIVIYDKLQNTPFANNYQREIYINVSANNGISWSAGQQLTKYTGNDRFANILQGSALYTFMSSRDGGPQSIYYNSIYSRNDEPAPPVVYGTSFHTEGATPNKLFVRVKIADTDFQRAVSMVSINLGTPVEYVLNDAGTNGDSLAGDKIYSTKIENLSAGNRITNTISASDAAGNTFTLPPFNHFIPLPHYINTATIYAGRITLGFDNKGAIADLQNTSIGSFQNYRILYSSGFMLSGRNSTGVWANGVFGASAVRDYLPGRVGGLTEDPLNQIYTVLSSDAPFGDAWQRYRYATLNGADFYDGNGDGVYTPFDLNLNGVWDANEDAPPLIGDSYAYTVFNDAAPSSGRRFTSMNPMGFEVKQSIFTKNVPEADFRDIVYVRYTINYKGAENHLDSVIFSCIADPDLGDFADDLVGYDLLRAGGYVYNYSSDALFGVQVPSLLITMLQPPYTYEPGVTYQDVNSNSIYDHGTDIAIDTSYIQYGPVLGQKTAYGAKYIPVSSFTHYMQPNAAIGDPRTPEEMRNLQRGGMTTLGVPIDPCTWSHGNGNTLSDCGTLDPKFLYTGSPSGLSGWLNTTQTDHRFLINAGPFRIEKNKPVVVQIAYVTGLAGTPRNSVNEARKVADFAHHVFRSNYTNFLTGTEEGMNLQPSDFSLEQNYPNPFNPETTIRYSLPAAGRISLSLYNILGERTAVLFEGIKEAGSHTINVGTGALAAGIYFYTLEYAGKSLSKKLVIIK